MEFFQRIVRSDLIKALRINNLQEFLIFLFIFFLPYDNFPIPIPGVSKPVSVLFLVISLLISFIHGHVKLRYSKSALWLLLFGLYGILITIFQALNKPFDIKQTNSIAVAIKGIVPMLMYVVGFIWIENYASKSYGFYKKMIYWALISLVIPTVFGVFQIILNALHLNVLLKILAIVPYIFTTRSHEEFEIVGRLRLLTMEPSWAGLQLVLYFAPILLLNHNFITTSKKTKIILSFLFLILLLSTGSAIGILWLGFILFVYLFYKTLQFFKTMKFKIISILILFTVPLFVGGAVGLVGGNLSYQFKKISALQGSGLEGEASTATRIICPYVGLLVFANENPTFGVGLSMFGFYMPEYAPDWYTLMPGEGKALADPNSAYFASTRNFFTKILAEMGIVGMILWLGFIYSVFRNIDLKSYFGKVWVLFLVSLVMGYMNYDSMANFYVQALLALVAVHGRWKGELNNA